MNQNKRGKRKWQRVYNNHVTFVGVNPAGAKSKWTTWKKTIMDTGASVWFLQETKCQTANKLKMENVIIYSKRK